MKDIFNTLKFATKVAMIATSTTVLNTITAMSILENNGNKFPINNGSDMQTVFSHIIGAFIGSTLPAIGLNIVNKLTFKEIYHLKSKEYIGMGILGYYAKDSFYDSYINKCQSEISNNSNQLLGDMGWNVVSYFRGYNVGEQFQQAYSQLQLNNMMLESCRVVANNKEVFLANTIVQTVLIDMIWNGFPWSNDKAQDLSEIEDIKQGLNDLGIEPQDDYYNEYVMAAA